jgi:hypothetical protein
MAWLPALFRRLEDEGDAAVEATGACQVLSRAQQHGRAAVVAAAVVHAGVAAEVRALGLLAQRQRVHVGAQAHHAGRIAAAQHAHHARAGQPLVHFQAGFAQRSGHDAGCPPLL